MRFQQATDPQMFVSDTYPTPERFTEPTNTQTLPIKPDGGLWTSTVRPDESSEWLEWLRSSHFYTGDEVIWILQPEADIDVYSIDAVEDYHELLESYGREPAYPSAWGEVVPDFEALVDTYDAIHLTAQGQRATRFSRPGLYGWDSESTLWLRWAFESAVRRGPLTEVLNDD